MDNKTLSFANWLLAELEAQGIKQADLHHRSGISRSVISNWINGRRVPDPPSCKRIAAALGLDEDIVLAAAGHRHLREPRAFYDIDRVLRKTQDQLNDVERDLREALSGQTVDIPYYGGVPADSVRWVEVQDQKQTVLVRVSDLGQRSKSNVFAVRALGDCLLSRGIVDGDLIYCERLRPNEEPQENDIVAVRIGSRRTLKTWHRDGDWIELRDGDEEPIFRFSILQEGDEFEVFGIAFFRRGELR